MRGTLLRAFAVLVLAFVVPQRAASARVGSGSEQRTEEAAPGNQKRSLEANRTDAGAKANPLARDPRELPRATPERWAGFLEEANLRANLEALPDPVRRALLAAESAYRAGDYPRAVQGCVLVLERAHDLPPAWILLATTYFRLRRYGDAAHAFERFLAVAPEHAWRTQGLGHCYYSLGRYGRAIEHYERVLVLLPDSVEAVRGLALANLRGGNEALALELLDRALALEPDHASAHAWKASVLYDLERSEEALVHAERARELEPWNPTPRYLCIQALYDLDRAEQARALEPRWRELDAAAQDIRRLEGRLRDAPRNLAFHDELFELYLKVDDDASLRAALERLLRLRPEGLSPVLIHGRAIGLLLRAKDSDAAAAWAQGLERTHSEDPDAWRVLLEYSRSIGDARGVRRAESRLQELSSR